MQHGQEQLEVPAAGDWGWHRVETHHKVQNATVDMHGVSGQVLGRSWQLLGMRHSDRTFLEC